MREQVRSPDYVPNQRGWIIRRDGTAEFQAVVIGGQPAPDYVVASGEEALRRTGIRSGNYVPDASGWRIGDDGAAEFLSGKFRGVVQSSAGDIGGCLLDGGGIRSRNYDPGVAGWKVGNEGLVEFGSGTFRGSARFVQPARRVQRTLNASDVPAGLYVVNGMTTNHYDADGSIKLIDTNSALQVPRTAIYTVAAGIRVRNDVAGTVPAGLHLRIGSSTTTPEPLSGLLIASQGSLMAASTQWLINASTPFKALAGDKLWMVFESDGQFDLIADRSTFLAVAYSSEA